MPEVRVQEAVTSISKGGTPEESVNSSGVLFIFNQQLWNQNSAKITLYSPKYSRSKPYFGRDAK
ncbi:MAG: hypothetical protein MSC56_04805 [Clostridiales bacterium]|nr:hypothetical protein [Clostridiales bacterium]